MSKHIQDDFVRDRQKDKSTSPDDLIQLMAIAKYVVFPHVISFEEMLMNTPTTRPCGSVTSAG